MKLNTNRLVALLALVALPGLAVAALQDSAPGDPSPEQLLELQAKAMELMAPGPEHEQLAKWAGVWEAEVNIRMMPGAEPMVVKNTTTSQMVLGDRFLQVHAEGDFMGMPFESLAMLGFDRRAGEYTTVGFDTMGTYWVSARGKWDEATKTLTLYGEDYDALMDFTQQYNFIYHWVDDDTYTMAVEFLDEVTTMGQGPFKMVEITYRRKS